MRQLFVLLLLVSCGPKVPVDPAAEESRRQALEAARKEREDPFSETNLQAYAAEMIPLVEAAAGRTFINRPDVLWVDPDLLGQLVVDECHELFERLYPGFTEERRHAMAESARFSLGNLLGKYTPNTHAVHISREAFETEVAESRHDLEAGLRMVKLTLAHELAHALQHEHADTVSALKTVPHADALDAWRGVSEGQATWIERKVAEELGWMEEHHVMTRLQGWENDALLDPRAFDIWSSYGLGMQFAQTIEKDYGIEVLWQIARDPPERTSVLFHPETWNTPVPEPALDYAGLLSNSLEGLTRNRAWNTINTPVGERLLRSEAKFTDDDALDAVIAQIVHAQEIQGELSDRAATVRILVMESPAAAGSYIALLKNQRLEEVKALAAAVGRPVTVTHEDFEEVAADETLLRIEQLLTDGGGLIQENRIFYAVRGRAVVMVTAERFRPGLRAGRTVEAVFEAYEAALD